MNFSTLAASSIRLSLLFGDVDQKRKLVRFVRKKLMIVEEKLFHETFSLPEPKFYPRIYNDCTQFCRIKGCGGAGLEKLLVFPVFETFIITPCRIYGKYDYAKRC